MSQVQRRNAIRDALAYRTFSEPAILVIASVIPIWLMANERKIKHDDTRTETLENVKGRESAQTYHMWQQSWQEETRARWTARLIDRVKPWTTHSIHFMYVKSVHSKDGR